ncbi:glutaredoxin family protein [Dyella sp. 20L07]|uniref:glutaredoxin family protein n=1 Tax=Dyella sp. 20L07 TaxID=3384240 RepID=UPI003D2C841F
MKIKGIVLVALFLIVGAASGTLLGPRLNAWLHPAAAPKPHVEVGDYASYVQSAGTPVVMFSLSTCPYCKEAREYFAANGISYKDYVVDQSPEAKQMFDGLKESGLPIIITRHHLIRGFYAAGIGAQLSQDGVPITPKTVAMLPR